MMTKLPPQLGASGLTAGRPTRHRHGVRIATPIIPALVAALACASLAAASASPVTPARGAKVPTSTPTFTWTVPEGETTTDVYVSSSRRTAPNGAPLTARVVDSQTFSNGELTWTPTRPLFAGAYWWSVKTRTADAKTLYSPPRAFSVRATGRITSLRLTRYTSRHHLFISAKWRSNSKTSALVLRVKRGGRVVWTQRLPKTSLAVDTEEFGLTTWIRPASIAQGTRMTLAATLQAGGFSRTLNRPFRAP
jgi:hypothetical protein